MTVMQKGDFARPDYRPPPASKGKLKTCRAGRLGEASRDAPCEARHFLDAFLRGQDGAQVPELWMGRRERGMYTKVRDVRSRRMTRHHGEMSDRRWRDGRVRACDPATDVKTAHLHDASSFVFLGKRNSQPTTRRARHARAFHQLTPRRPVAVHAASFSLIGVSNDPASSSRDMARARDATEWGARYEPPAPTAHG